MPTEPEDRRAEAALQTILDADARGDFAQACRLAARGSRRHPRCLGIRAAWAHCLVWLGRHAEAGAVAAEARAADPDSPFAWAAEAEVAAFQGRFEDSRHAVERALSLDAETPWVLARCADACVGQGDTGAALVLLAPWRARQPEDESAVWHTLNALLAAGRHREAEEILRDAESRFPLSGHLRYWRGVLLQRDGRPAEAIPLLRAAAEALAGSFLAWGELAQALSLAGSAGEAEAAARRALALSPCCGSALRALARVCRGRGDARGAARWEARAFAAIPALRVHRFMNAASTAMRQGAWSKALAAAEDVVPSALPQARRLALGVQARALVELGRFDAAEEALREMDAAGDDSAALYELRGRICLARCRWSEAASVLRAGIARHPAEGALRAVLLRALHAAGARDQERHLIGETLVHPPDSPAGVAAMVAALCDTHHAAEAQRLRRLGQERYPEAPQLRLFDALDRLERGDLAGARREARQLTGEWRAAAYTVERTAAALERLRPPPRRLLEAPAWPPVRN